jgi:putative SOS response-associated peptidase YedK
MGGMCGRIIQSSPPDQLRLKILMGTPDDSRVRKAEAAQAQAQARYNGAPGQEHWVIRQNPETGERSLDRLWWGLIPYWCKESGGGRRPINAKAETVASLPTFRDAYKRCRCILPIDNFFEWKAIKGAKIKQPYAIGMRSGEPFGLAAIWENWKRPGTDDWVRSFAVITCPANEMMADIHERMPVIIPPESYDHWLGTLDPDPRNLLVPYPSAPMRMWPISKRVNRPENDDAGILEPLATAERDGRLL